MRESKTINNNQIFCHRRRRNKNTKPRAYYREAVVSWAGKEDPTKGKKWDTELSVKEEE